MDEVILESIRAQGSNGLASGSLYRFMAAALIVVDLTRVCDFIFWQAYAVFLDKYNCLSGADMPGDYVRHFIGR